MPKRFTPEQLASSAAAGEPRLKTTFRGDDDAFHEYQLEWFGIFVPGQVLPPPGAERVQVWDKARRQRKASCIKYRASPQRQCLRWRLDIKALQYASICAPMGPHKLRMRKSGVICG